MPWLVDSAFILIQTRDCSQTLKTSCTQAGGGKSWATFTLLKMQLAQKGLFQSWFFFAWSQMRNDRTQYFSRLYWYRGVTVLLPGWVIWKYWDCPCKFFSLGCWLVSALSTPNGGERYNSSTDLNPNTITSIQLQCIQSSRPHLSDKTTSKPQPKYCMYQFSPHQPPYCTDTCIWNKYPKRVALATKYFNI